ncbi:MAG: c-type cytochrome biogenesis protein CcsB [Pedobacter sp.]
MTIDLLLFRTTLAIYAVATGLALTDIMWRRPAIGRHSRVLLWSGFGLHCLTLVNRYLATGFLPLSSLHESLSFFAWAIVGTYLLFHMRYRLAVLGAFVTPLALVLMIFGSTVPMASAPLNPSLQSVWLPVHVGLAFLGDAVFALAAVAGGLYLLQERMLKKKKVSSLFYRLPSLQTLDNLNHRCLSIGFPLMTLGIITGAIWADQVWGAYWSWDPKETWALITWFLYAALLHGRLAIGWRGRKASILAILGFACLLFTFFGVNLLLSGLHSYATFGTP